MNTQNIPQADFAIIGGSGTLSSNFPLGAKCDDVKIIQDRMVFRYTLWQNYRTSFI
mgnify:CR=1 FL=1